MRNAASQL